MSNDSTATSPTPAPERSRGRRFRSQFCRFHAIGTVNRPPTYARSRRGRASATLSILTGEDRDLDLIVFDRDEATLRHRLHGLQAGARVYVEGTVQAPRLSQRELPQFLAEVIFHTGDHAPAPAAGVTAE
jgi:hypothetical protein